MLIKSQQIVIFFIADFLFPISRIFPKFFSLFEIVIQRIILLYTV